MTWEQIIAANAPVITVVIGLFVWLRADIRRLEDKLEGDIKRLEDKLSGDIRRVEDKLENKLESESKRLEDKLEGDIRRLEGKLETGLLTVEDRLRGVETEQARVAGLLEGLALTGKVPDPGAESH